MLAAILNKKASQQHKLKAIEEECELSEVSETHDLRFMLVSLKTAVEKCSALEIHERTGNYLRCLEENLPKDDFDDVKLIRNYAVKQRSSNLLHYVAVHNKVSVIRELRKRLSTKIWVELFSDTDANDLTPLMLAVGSSSLDFIAQVIDMEGIDAFVNQRNREGFNALMLALLTHKVQIARTLSQLRDVLNVENVSKRGLSAMMLLAKSNLRGSNADLRVIYKNLLFSGPGAVKAQSNTSSLCYCLAIKNKSFFEQLLNDVPDSVNLQNIRDGQTPLIKVCADTRFGFEEKKEYIQLLLDFNADLELTEKSNLTALELFVSRCKRQPAPKELEVIKILWKAGCKPRNVLSNCFVYGGVKEKVVGLILDIFEDIKLEPEMYKAILQHYENKFRSMHGSQVPRQLRLLDRFIEGDRNSSHWTLQDIYTLLKNHVGNNFFPKLRLIYAINHISDSRLQEELGEYHSLLSVACNFSQGVYLRHLIKRGLERGSMRVPFRIKRIEQRPREEVQRSRGVSNCLGCRRRHVSVYLEEPAMKRLTHGRDYICMTCAYRPKETITNLQYLKYSNRIYSFSLAFFIKSHTKVIPFDSIDALLGAGITSSQLLEQLELSGKAKYLGI